MRARIPQLTVLAGAFIGCLFLSVPAAFLLLAAGAVMMLLHEAELRQRRRTLSGICDDIDRILRGADELQLSDYQEGELSILSTQLQKLSLQLREQNAALRQEQRMMKETLEDISHQLRTPLTSMILIVDMLRSPHLTREAHTENLMELSGLMTQMQWLIETLLGLSRLDAGAVTFQPVRIPAAELVRRATEPIAVTLELKSITVETEIQEDAAFSGDLQYCTEAVTNLLKNCMEHTPSGGRIQITAEENSIYTRFLITDSGPGFAEADLPHIFERFYRSDHYSKTGYGIGLAFAQRIITAQNGSLLARNAPPMGAQFDIRFYKTTV